MIPSLLAIKLRCPAVPKKHVTRPHLTRILNEGLDTDRYVTLVSAPAGFGKTTCISEWLAELESPNSWLSLEAADNDPVRFLQYFIAALQRISETTGIEIANALQSGQLPPFDVISTSLLNDILDWPECALVILDDFHVIQDRFILQVLEKLISNSPPTLHLVIITREDPPLPLARLRAHNLLTEIRAADLRFTQSEAGEFLNTVMGLRLTADDISNLEAHTEGWIVGIQLAGLSLRERDCPGSFISNLGGSHRFILSYLVEEVLNHQTDDTQQFLLQTSILERLHGDLCDTITGRSDSRLLLERLHNANLFLVPLDDKQEWYRYHRLFADLLRERQKTMHREQTIRLHQQASVWFSQEGMIDEAMQHALTAADFPAAINLLENHTTEMLIQGYASTVEGWMKAIPAQWDTHRPKSDLAFAWMYLFRGDYLNALPYIERLQIMDSSIQENTSLNAEWLALQAMLLNIQQKPEESLELATYALKIVPESDGDVRSLIAMALAGAYQQTDDYEHALQAYHKIIEYGRTGGNSVSEILGMSGLVQMALQHGRYHLAFKVASQGIEHVESRGIYSPINAALYGALGQVYFQWHDLDKVERLFQRAIHLSNLGGYSDAEIGNHLNHSRIFLMQGNTEMAAYEIQKATELMKSRPPAWVQEEVISQEIRVLLEQNRLEEAEKALGAMYSGLTIKKVGQDTGSWNITTIFEVTQGQDAEDEYSFLPKKITHPLGQLLVSTLRILLYRFRTTHERQIFERGIGLADYVITHTLQGNYLQAALEALLQRAQFHAEDGDDQTSLDDYRMALELAQPEGYISLFVEEGQPVAVSLNKLPQCQKHETVKYLQTILDAFGNSQSSDLQHNKRPGTFPTTSTQSPAAEKTALQIDPLTERELEVLRLIAEGLKYEEIGGRLFISLNTVRTYIKGIYSKLNVNNRSKVVSIAQRLKLI